MRTKLTGAAVAAVLTLPAANAAAQDAAVEGVAPRAQSAAELLDLMRDQGYKVPDALNALADGSVSVPEKPNPNAFNPDDIWDNRFELSFSSTQGNAEQTSLRLGYDGSRETPDGDLSLDASYFYAEAESDTTNDQATIGAQYDWNLNDSKWSPFVEGRFDYDSFQSWEYRLQSFAGVGYDLYESDTQELTLRAGAGVVREFNSPRNEFIPEALLGVDYSLQLSDRQSLEFEGRYFPSLLDFSEFRATAKLGWRFDIDEVFEGFSLSAGVEFEHQSEVDDDVENNDVLLFAGIGIDF